MDVPIAGLFVHDFASNVRLSDYPAYATAREIVRNPDVPNKDTAYYQYLMDKSSKPWAAYKTEAQVDDRINRLKALAKDIRGRGIQNPINVYTNDDAALCIIEGTHRTSIWSALGHDTVPAVLGCDYIPALPEDKRRGYTDGWLKVLADVHDLHGKDGVIYQPIPHIFFERHEIIRAGHDRLAAIMPHVSRLKINTAIDLGCACGYFSHSLASAGLGVVGVDHFPSAVHLSEFSRKFYPKSQARFVQCDIFEFIKRLLNVDLVLCMSVQGTATLEFINRVAEISKYLIFEAPTNYDTDRKQIPVEPILERCSFPKHELIFTDPGAAGNVHGRKTYLLWK